MLGGTASSMLTCQPARSSTSTLWSSGPTESLIHFRCIFVASMFTHGEIIAAELPVSGHTASYSYNHLYLHCLIVQGREPLRARFRVVEPC